MTPVAEMAPDQQRESGGISWTTVAWFGALLIVCYAPVLRALIHQWDADADMGHGFFVPVIAAYIVWQKRRELATQTPSINWWGLAIVIFAALQLYLGTLGAELFTSRTAFVESIVGAVLFLGGTGYLRIIAFPLFLLFFMVPIPAIIYNSLTFRLQVLASRLATWAISNLDIPVLREGNILHLAQQSLSVVEACSGIRSLLSLSFLSLVYGYFFEKKIWMKVALFVATVPIAIIANASRVTLTGVLTQYKPELAEGFFHTASGWVIFIVGMAMMMALHQLFILVERLAHGKK
jgi:exosortase